MEITIGVKHAPRELSLESEQSVEEVRAALDTALESGKPLVLTDEKDRQVIVDPESIAYIELDPKKEQRRVGIGIA